MILVTGGCGYIGSHLVKSLSESGEQVVVFDNLSQGNQTSLLHNEELIIGDITDREALKKLFSMHDISAVMHLAALVNAAESVEKADLYREVNADGSRNVWQAATDAGVKVFLYASSAAVYGIPESAAPIQETALLHPSNPYGATKLAGEISLQEVMGEKGNYGIFRFFNVGGAGEPRLGQSHESRAIMQRLFAVAAKEEKEITISGNDYDTDDGTVVRDFVHVEDIVRGFLLGMRYLQQGGDSFTCNLGAGRTTTMKDLHALVEEITGCTIPINYGPRKPGDISFSLSDIALARRVLGWEPEHSVKDIIESGWRSYVQRKK